jgi:hypothetical protein
MANSQPSGRNDAAPWSDFDANGYWKFNYATVLPEDAQIIRRASSFLAGACGGRPQAARAVDVGAGANLYPALLMLPWAAHIIFTEYAESNLGWLAENLADAPGEWAWQPFWNLLANLPGYQRISRPRHRLATSSTVRHLSIFDLPRRTWDLGSMFFVADGMTSDEDEFEAAVRSFLGSLIPGAPFMMAFMEGSAGYDVSGIQFPAVRVTPLSLETLLGNLPVHSTDILRTDKSARPLRPGYNAMLLATGYVR